MKEQRPHEDPALLRELMARRMSRRDLLKVAGAGAGVVALGPLLAACGGSTSSGSSSSASPAKGSSTPIKFVFSADPTWNWLEDKGIIKEMENASGYHIARNETEDEFAFFAGGHADIVSMGSYEVPVLEKETGVKTVTFAKYNKAKDMLCVDPAKGYNSFADLPKPRQGRPRVRDQLGPRLDRAGQERGTRPGGAVGRPADRRHRLRRRARAGAQGTARRRLYRRTCNAVKYLTENKVKDHVRRQGRSRRSTKRSLVPGHEGFDSNNFVCTKTVLRCAIRGRSPSSPACGSGASKSSGPTCPRSSRSTRTTSAGRPTAEYQWVVDYHERSGTSGSTPCT